MSISLNCYAYSYKAHVTTGVTIQRQTRENGCQTVFACIVRMAPAEALDMAGAMMDENGRFIRKDGGCSVEVWREAGESDELIWMNGEDEIRIPIDPRDGWSWNYAEDIKESAERLL